MTSDLVYRCRRCNDQFTMPVSSDEVNGGSGLLLMQVSFHECQPGKRGVADLIGCDSTQDDQ